MSKIYDNVEDSQYLRYGDKGESSYWLRHDDKDEAILCLRYTITTRTVRI